MSFFEKLSKASVWQPILQPATNNLQPLTVDRRKDDTWERHRTQSVNSSAWPTPGEATPSQNGLRNATPPLLVFRKPISIAREVTPLSGPMTKGAQYPPDRSLKHLATQRQPHDFRKLNASCNGNFKYS